MHARSLGTTGLTVSALGLGCMGMSDFYGPADEAASVATIHAALDAGITLLDTGDYYAAGHNELLIREALSGRQREQAVISVKFGLMRGPDGSIVGNDLRPAAVKNFLAYTLRRLGTDYVDVYRPRPHLPGRSDRGDGGRDRRDGRGGVRAPPRPLGGRGQDDPRAHAVHPVTDVQIEYSLISRGIEEEILRLPRARDRGDRLRRLSRGLLSGHWSTEREASLTAHDFRASAPRFQGENLARNLELVETLRAVADEKDATVAQLAIAWALSRGDDVVPLVGARTRERLAESLGAVEVDLTQDDLTRIENAVPVDAVAGERYHAEQMAILDSERG